MASPAAQNVFIQNLTHSGAKMWRFWIVLQSHIFNESSICKQCIYNAPTHLLLTTLHQNNCLYWPQTKTYFNYTRQSLVTERQGCDTPLSSFTFHQRHMACTQGCTWYIGLGYSDFLVTLCKENICGQITTYAVQGKYVWSYYNFSVSQLY